MADLPSNQDSDANPDQTLGAGNDRRRFIRQTGKVIFSVLVLDVLHSTALAQYDPPCSSTAPDASCSSSDQDQHCGVSGDVDQSCNSTPAGSPDENCNMTQQSGPTSGGAGHDKDQHCGVGGSADNCCGDCDDDHDVDGHCGQALPAGGGTDPEELCGHQHYIGVSEDQVCSATVADQGCGNHNGGYGTFGSSDDPDQHCVGGNTDQHCSASTTDDTCGSHTNPSTTSPDEGCGVADRDEACGHYDRDQSCNAVDTDAGCGYNYGPGIPGLGGGGIDPDNHAM